MKSNVAHKIETHKQYGFEHKKKGETATGSGTGRR